MNKPTPLEQKLKRLREEREKLREKNRKLAESVKLKGKNR